MGPGDGGGPGEGDVAGAAVERLLVGRLVEMAQADDGAARLFCQVAELHHHLANVGVLLDVGQERQQRVEDEQLRVVLPDEFFQPLEIIRNEDGPLATESARSSDGNSPEGECPRGER